MFFSTLSLIGFLFFRKALWYNIMIAESLEAHDAPCEPMIKPLPHFDFQDHFILEARPFHLMPFTLNTISHKTQTKVNQEYCVDEEPIQPSFKRPLEEMFEGSASRRCMMGKLERMDRVYFKDKIDLPSVDITEQDQLENMAMILSFQQKKSFKIAFHSNLKRTQTLSKVDQRH